MKCWVQVIKGFSFHCKDIIVDVCALHIHVIPLFLSFRLFWATFWGTCMLKCPKEPLQWCLEMSFQSPHLQSRVRDHLQTPAWWCSEPQAPTPPPDPPDDAQTEPPAPRPSQRYPPETPRNTQPEAPLPILALRPPPEPPDKSLPETHEIHPDEKPWSRSNVLFAEEITLYIYYTSMSLFWGWVKVLHLLLCMLYSFYRGVAHLSVVDPGRGLNGARLPLMF